MATQPNFENAARALQGLANEICLIPNIPILRAGDDILVALKDIQDAIHKLEVGNYELNANVHQLQGGFRDLCGGFQELRGDFLGLQNGSQDTKNRLALVEGQVCTLTEDHDLLPLRLFNSSLDESAEIRYPLGFQGMSVPKTRHELVRYDGIRCRELIQCLGLKPAAPEASVVLLRKRIADYLGVCI